MRRMTEGNGKKRRKSERERKEDMIVVRVTADQKQLFVEAADAAGLDVSSWLRSLGVREAKVLMGKG